MALALSQFQSWDPPFFKEISVSPAVAASTLLRYDVLLFPGLLTTRLAASDSTKDPFQRSLFQLDSKPAKRTSDETADSVFQNPTRF